MSSDLKELKSQQRQVRSTFEGIRQFIGKFKREKHEVQVETRLEILEEAMQKLYVLRRKIEVLTEEADERELMESKADPADLHDQLEALIEKRQLEHSSIIQQAEDTYCELKSSLQRLRANLVSGSSSGPSVASIQGPTALSTVKLPEIRLPSFGGKIRDWVTFRDMFRSLIHRNQQLTDIDKFTYLRSSLEGEALREIGMIEITAANYIIAWEQLQKRYENKKLIVKAHIDALFAVEPLKRENYDSLCHLISEYDRNLQMLDKIGEDTSKWSTILVHMVCSRLDAATLRNWETHHASTQVPTYDQLMEFLRKHCAILQSIAPAKSAQMEVRKPKFTVSHAQTSAPASSRCPFCSEEMHSAFKCQRFIKMKIPERYDKVKRCGLCLNCLSPSHLVRACTAGVCRHCQKKHHSLLHSGGFNGGRSAASTPQNDSSGPQVQNRSQVTNTQQTQPQAQNQPTHTQAAGPSTSSFPIANTSSLTQTPPPPTTTDPTLPSNSLPATIHTSTRQVLLSTALVRVSDRYGNTQLARVLLDSCSEYCFVTTKLSQKLRLAETSSYLSVAGIGGSVVQSTKKVEATISPRSSSISSYSETIQLHVLPKLTSELPINPVNVHELAIPSGMILADPNFHKPGPIDIILGAEYYYDLLLEDKLKLSDDGPTLQGTVFGWVVSGRVPGNVVEVPTTVTHSCSTLELRELMAKFWELESCNSSSTLSVEEAVCEDIFEKTTVRDSEGSFVVTLPKKEHVINQLRDSRTTALKRLHGMERRFATNDQLKALYVDFVQEYLSMNHMREVDGGEDKLAYYLPHHAVLKPESTTTKLRVVFDGSCRSSSGISLNDGLMVGPVVQDDLFSIILRFRSWEFVLVADIAKMYRMVKVAEDDQPLQRILWRDSPDQPVRTYELTTVTYGTASAPYLATKCLQRLGTEGEALHPVAAKVVRKDFYVDDLLTGTDSIEEGKTLASELISLTNSAGFNLRKWSSNNPELLSTIPSELRDDRTTLELDSSTSVVKTLGLIWEPSRDSFKFAVPRWSAEPVITKRVILSDTARIFDPLGLIGPVTVQAKIFLQQLWKEKSDWDEPLPDSCQAFWNEFRWNASAMESLAVPRWIGFNSKLASVELHGFCDASVAAYGACLYLRCETTDGSVTVRLITSKSRVAPLEDLSRKKKKQSIPRLELSSALLLSHLYEKFCTSVQIPAKAYFWTDSMIVKCWLSSLPSRWQIFVANRVSEIQHITKSGIWNHVAGAENPADIVSRGMTPAQLAYQTLWFEGPLWLRQDQSTWPKSATVQSELDSALLEERPSTSVPVQIKPPNPIFSLRSSFSALVRIVAWIRRFRHNAVSRNRSCKRSGNLSTKELNESELQLVQLAQSETFPAEIAALSKNQQISPSSKLIAANPSLMEGVLRVGGRLQNAPIPEGRKHPLILHHQHPLTKLIMEHYHRKLFHAGQQLLISSAREKFWPLRARDVARWTVHRCVSCFRNKPKVHEQLMADLPSVRVTPGSVFLRVGIDLCGPFYIRYPGRKSAPIKSFVCIFVCLATKAVHLEIVADLSTQAFLASFKRFVAIRGKPRLVMCDNATNFVGANKELEALRQLLNDQQVQHAMVNAALEDGIEFKFIPPRTPNFGGLWEAAVKSFKGHFRKTIGDRVLTYDEFHTVVHQVAAILNSRPLTPLSNDPNDFSALTPGHFLVGRPLTAVPEPDLQEVPENRLSHWQRTQDFVQQLWRKWKTQYLSDLHNRTRWSRKRDNIHVGTMVFIKEDNLPPQKWRLGRVTEIFPSQDGNVRVVSVRTQDGVFKRGISKICILPIRDNDQESPSEEQ
ncbi:uncharacterized protein LOC134290294 [Aedes albopictus]|uniref:Integrase catalytic domain-containing protein n=1 Tax=Aedes albopictus TaxID=7160 RepID=A0ABM1ZKA9_AEDAL